MSHLFFALVLFLIGYILNMFYITVLYHRALTHKAVELTSFGMALTHITGNWVTGIDPKAWALMHRLHHQHSDTELDPHSPVHYGVFGVAWAQLKSYRSCLSRLIKSDHKSSQLVSDLPFGVNFLNRSGIWFLPYSLHLIIGVGFAYAFTSWICGIAYFLGIMSHPVQGWMVNSLAHRFGYESFNNSDNSKNNVLIALLVFGEGYQNNHHASPESSKFSNRWYEFDPGYCLCIMGMMMGIVRPKMLKYLK